MNSIPDSGPDVIHGGQGYRRSANDLDPRLDVIRASRPVRCGLNGCPIGRGEWYLYSTREGRLCVPCAIGIGALEPLTPAGAP